MKIFYSLFLLKTIKFPKIDPNIKLVPTMKLMGTSIVSLINKSTLFLSELFCIPMNKITNKQELNIDAKNNFLIKKFISINNFF